MQQQEELFYETWERAIDAAIPYLGGYQKVAARLWPLMKLQTAYSKLKACLNEDKEREKFTTSEILALTKWANEAGCHTAATYFNRATGYEDPKPVNPEERKAELEKQVLAMGEDLTKALAELKRIQVAS